MFTSSSWLIDKARHWQLHRGKGGWVAGRFTFDQRLRPAVRGGTVVLAVSPGTPDHAQPGARVFGWRADDCTRAPWHRRRRPRRWRGAINALLAGEQASSPQREAMLAAQGTIRVEYGGLRVLDLAALRSSIVQDKK